MRAFIHIFVGKTIFHEFFSVFSQLLLLFCLFGGIFVLKAFFKTSECNRVSFYKQIKSIKSFWQFMPLIKLHCLKAIFHVLKSN